MYDLVNLKLILKTRRSIPKLKKSENFDKDKLVEIITDNVNTSPTAYNSQSSSVLVLLGESNDNFWIEVMNRILPKVPDNRKPQSREKLNGFKNGDGTIIFLEDETINRSLEDKFPSYANSVREWSAQSQGFLQYGIWLSLTSDGLSASLQHYNPLIDDYIYNNLDVDRKYRIIGMMPFGKADTEPSEKFYNDITKRVVVKE